MKKDTVLWDAVAMVGEDLLTEAMEKPERQTKRQKKSVWILAAAAVVLVSFAGWAAKEWVFAPGRGLVPTEILTDVQVFAGGEQTVLGKITLEGITFAENRTDPMENRLTFWVFRRAEDAMGDGATDWEGKGYLEGNSFTAEINGVQYRSAGAGYSTSGWGCYTFRPVENQPAPDPVGETCTVTVAYEEPDMTVEPVTVLLYPAETGEAVQRTITKDTSVTLLPLTENLIVGNFYKEEWLPLVQTAGNTSVHANFATITDAGEAGMAAGTLNLCGIQTDYDCIRAVPVNYNDGIASMELYDFQASFSFRDNSLPAYTFPLMEVGETHVPESDVYLLDMGGFTCRLVSVSRDKTGLRYETEYLYTGKDNHVTPAYAEVRGVSIGMVDYVNGTMHIQNPEAWRWIAAEEDGTLTCFSGEEDPVLSPGDPVTVYLQHMAFRYGQSCYTEGSEPVASFTFH
ncbi:MAG: hypothetical protein IJB15_04095 [Clostridia bacterium]|nr:hypothetical protein [Clostridia bacterium]